MIFEKSYITRAGNALLTRSASGTHAIVWTRCGLYQHEGINTLTDAQIIELLALNNPVATGQPSALFQENGVTRISCQCSNDHDGEGGEALAFGLWAKIDGDASDVLFAIAKTGTYSPVTFPAYDGTMQTKLVGIVDLSLKIESAAGSSIGVEPSVFALAKDLQTQIELVADLQTDVENLTTKAVTIDTTQTITGAKTFEAGTKFESEITTGQFGKITSVAIEEDSCVMMSAHVMNANGSQVLKKGFISVFADTERPEIELDAEDGKITMVASNIYTSTYCEVESKGLASDCSLKIGATCYNAQGTQAITSSYIHFLNDPSQPTVSIAAEDGYVEIRARRLVSYNQADLGASNYHFSTLYVDSINGTPFAAADGVKFDSTNGITLNPTRISGANEGVGQIALILVRSQQANTQFPIGTEISSMSYDVTFAKSKRSVANSVEFAVGRSVPTGSHWRILNEVESNDAPAEGTYNTYLCLAIRIS